MKKHLLILAVAALAFSFNTAKAQIIATADDAMETWSHDGLNFSAMDPNNGTPATPGWQCLNPLSSTFTGNSPVSVFEENTIVHGGSHSCKLTSVALSVTSYAYVSSFLKHDTCGFVMAGTITATPSFKLGVPFNKRITNLKFWYQYIPQNGQTGQPDTASCSVVLTHHTSTTNILGAGELLVNAAGTWTQGTVPITYDSLSGNPDTIIVVFSSSSYYKPGLGSILYIDDVTYTNPSSVNEVGADTHVEVYPNPASTQVNFSIAGQNAHSIEIYDITGKKVNTYPVKDNMSSISTASYHAGLYFYQIRNIDGNMIKLGKFSVAR